MTKKSIYNWIILLLILFNSCNKTEKPNENWLPGQDWLDIRDNMFYKTVQIGNQVWMAENLNFISDSGSWAYNNEPNNAEIYGRLYNWEAAIKSCPTGWHLPTDTEWKELETYIGMKQDELDYIGFRGSNEGGKLKDTGYTHWQSPNDEATDLFDFCALPSGLCENGELFTFLGTHAFFWTSTQDSTQRPWSRSLYYKNGCIERYYDNKTICFSVRCIKDN